MTASRVMVIDDSPLVLELVRSFLHSAGHEVITREMAVGTRAAVLRERPDMVLLDINMPLLNGVDICRAIREHSLIGSTYIILHSDRPEGELARLAKQCGANGYIRKTQDRAKFMREFGAATEEAAAAPHALFVGSDATWRRLARELASPFALVNAGSGLELLRRLAVESPHLLLIGTSVADVPWRTLHQNTSAHLKRGSVHTIVIAEEAENADLDEFATWHASAPIEQLAGQLQQLIKER